MMRHSPANAASTKYSIGLSAPKVKPDGSWRRSVHPLVITPARRVCLSSKVRLGRLSLALIEEANGPAKVAKGVASLDGGYTFATRKRSDQKQKRWAFRSEKNAVKTLGKLLVGQ